MLKKFDYKICIRLIEDNNFNPLIYCQVDGPVDYKVAPLELIGLWCARYLHGINLDPIWDADVAAIDTLSLLAILSGTDFPFNRGKDLQKAAGKVWTEHKDCREHYRQLLPKLVEKLYEIWSDYRKLAQPLY